MNQIYYFLLLLFSVSSLLAETEKSLFEDALLFRDEAIISFKPTTAYVVITDTEKILTQQAFLIIEPRDEAHRVSALLPLTKERFPVGTTLFYATYYLSEDDQMYAAPSRSLVVGKGNVAPPESLRESLVTKKEKIKRYSVQIKEQKKALSRLQADLGVIGYFHKAVEVEREAEELERDIAESTKQIDMFKQLLSEVKKTKKPAQYTLLKRNLSSDLEALRPIVSEIERKSQQSMKQLDSQLLDDLSLIELTRDQDLEQLQQELIRLRTLRERQQPNGSQ